MGRFNLKDEVSQLLDVAQSLIHTNPAESLRLARFCADRAEALGEGPVEARSWLIATQAWRAIPSHLLIAEELNVAAENACRLARLHGLHDLWINATDAFADVLYSTDLFDGAADFWLQLLEEGLDCQVREAVVRAYIGIGKLFWTYNDTERSLASFMKARTFLDAKTPDNVRICLNINIAAHHYRGGEYQAAHAILDETEALLSSMAFCEFEPEIYYYRAYLFRSEGRLVEALIQFERALALNSGTSNSWGRTVTMIGMGEIKLDLEECHSALYYLQQALEIAESIPSRYLIMEAHGGIARCYQAMGLVEREMKHWQQHFALSEAMHRDQMNEQLSSFKRHSLHLRISELEGN